MAGERKLEGRVDALERQHDELRASLQRVELEQAHMREVLDTRFDALTKGQDVLLTKFEALSKHIVHMAGDTAATPAGRATLELIGGMQRRVDELSAKQHEDALQLVTLKTQSDKLEGALSFAKQSGIGAILLALSALALAIGKFWLAQ